MVTSIYVSRDTAQYNIQLTIGSSGISLQVHLGHLAVLNLESEALAAGAAKNGSGAIKAHIEGLGKGSGRVSNPANLQSAR